MHKSFVIKMVIPVFRFSVCQKQVGKNGDIGKAFLHTKLEDKLETRHRKTLFKTLELNTIPVTNRH